MIFLIIYIVDYLADIWIFIFFVTEVILTLVIEIPLVLLLFPLALELPQPPQI